MKPRGNPEACERRTVSERRSEERQRQEWLAGRRGEGGVEDNPYPEVSVIREYPLEERKDDWG